MDRKGLTCTTRWLADPK